MNYSWLIDSETTLRLLKNSLPAHLICLNKFQFEAFKEEQRKFGWKHSMKMEIYAKLKFA